MARTLSPRCNRCGQRSDETGDAFLVDPESLEVVCFSCWESDPQRRQEIRGAVIRESLRRFREEFGRLPDSTDELVSWLDDNVDGEKGPLHLIGPKPEDAD